MKRTPGKLTHRPGRGYTRDIGWVTTANGKRSQKRFHLGHDPLQAQRAVCSLEQLWSRIDREHTEAGLTPTWPETDLWVATHIARGYNVISVPMPPGLADAPEPQRSHFYAMFVGFLRANFPMVAFQPADSEAATRGQEIAASRAHTLAQQSAWRDEQWQSWQAAANLPLQQQMAAAQMPQPPRLHNGQMLHNAIEAFALWLGGRHVQTAGAQRDRARLLKDSIADRPLDEFGRDAIQEIATYWSSRPKARKMNGERDRPIRPQTVINMLGDARRFVRWLDESDTWQWTMPKGAERLLTITKRSLLTPEEIAAKRHGVTTWSLEELVDLYRMAGDHERLLMLLALNLGAGGAEISTLRVSEIDRGEDPPVVRRIRVKSHVFGQWPLWPETLKAIDAHASARTDNHIDLAVVSSRGKPYDGKNVGNRWTRFLAEVKNTQPGFRHLGFKYLRKTAAQLVRDASDGEIAGVFLAHGNPVASDDLVDVYSNRPFNKVAVAVMQVRERLAPMFAAAAPKEQISK